MISGRARGHARACRKVGRFRPGAAPTPDDVLAVAQGEDRHRAGIRHRSVFSVATHFRRSGRTRDMVSAMRPRVLVNMASSLDGKITPEPDAPGRRGAFVMSRHAE